MKKIELQNFTKAIKSQNVLDNVSYSFERGKIYGIFGRNGSGKTMLLRAIAGLIFPTDGKVFVDEKELHKDIDFPDSMGVIIENIELLPQFNAFTNLKILSKIKNIATDEDINSALDSVGLSDAKTKKVKAFSLGMKQKLSIAQAIFEKPALLLLDEPTNALDQDSIEKIRILLLNLKNQGCTILLASHNKDDIALLSDEILEMVDGRIV